jgi:hypothetical protein
MKKTFFVICLLLLAAGCNSKYETQNSSPATSSEVNQSANPTPTTDLKNAGPPIYNGRPIFVGTLQVSDDSSKGNLILLAVPDPRMPGDIQKETKLYIQTQRDYTSLIGKKVLAGFTGDPNNHINSFKLINIVEDTGQTSFPE